MRKYFFMIFATFFAGNLWAACELTTQVLTKKSRPDYDEYLYIDTSQRETRQEGETGMAYLCGYKEDKDGCDVGEKFAFEGAAVGGNNHTELTVYTCAGDDKNYYWTAVTVKNKCYSDKSVNVEPVGEKTLYKVDGDYCKEVVYLKDVISEIVNKEILSNNDTLLEQFWEELNKEIENVYSSKEFTAAVVTVVKDMSLSEDNLKTIIGLINTEIQKSDFAGQIGDIELDIDEINSRIEGLEKRVDVTEDDIERLREGLNQAVKQLHDNGADDGLNLRKTKEEFNKVWDKLDAMMSTTEIEVFVNEQITALEDEIMVLIKAQGENLDDFKNEVKNIEAELQKQLDAVNARLTPLEERIKDLEDAKIKILQDLDSLAATNESLESAIADLEKKLEDKVTLKQVLETVTEELAKANLNENQQSQVIKLIKDYGGKLSDEQWQAVEKIIEVKISKGFKEINAANQLQDAQMVSQDKVNSAMSVLNAFAAGQDASVWRNADGKFNTARLASDATASVILGTAGGLISNKIIKKNQIKKGFEGIGCYVGGQVVADYGDEFTVGMM